VYVGEDVIAGVPVATFDPATMPRSEDTDESTGAPGDVTRLSDRRWTRRLELLLAFGLPLIALLAFVIAIITRWIRQ
jgi:hypothetical protein